MLSDFELLVIDRRLRYLAREQGYTVMEGATFSVKIKDKILLTDSVSFTKLQFVFAMAHELGHLARISEGADLARVYMECWMTPTVGNSRELYFEELMAWRRSFKILRSVGCEMSAVDRIVLKKMIRECLNGYRDALNRNCVVLYDRKAIRSAA
jgi:hypothetical protein